MDSGQYGQDDYKHQQENGITTYTIIARKIDDIIKRSARQCYDGLDYMTATISMASKINKEHKTFSWDIAVLDKTLPLHQLFYVERRENEENRIKKLLYPISQTITGTTAGRSTTCSWL